MKLVVARHGGACFGVKRAVKLAEEALGSSPAPVWCLGPLIHNPLEVGRLEKKGLRVASGLTGADSGTIVIRSHGVPSSVRGELSQRGLAVVDATCPFVGKVQDIAGALSREGRMVIVVGDADHPEVEGIVSYIDGPFHVVADPAEVPELPPGTRVGVVEQTTQSRTLLDDVVSRLRGMESDLVVHNTLCGATQRRQEEVLRRAAEADLVVVVGGRESANTRRLVQLSESLGVFTVLVESGEELDPAVFEGRTEVFLTAGASTPQWVIDETITRIRRLVPGILCEGGTPQHEGSKPGTGE